MQCMYDGVHGVWPSGSDGDQITLWFLLRFDRSIPLSATVAQDRANALDAAKHARSSLSKRQGTDVTGTDMEVAKNEAIGDYINRKPIQEPTMPPTAEPTNAPSKITPEEIAAGLP